MESDSGAEQQAEDDRYVPLGGDLRDIEEGKILKEGWGWCDECGMFHPPYADGDWS